MTITDALLLARIKLAAKTDADLGLFEPDKHIARLLGDEGRVDATARDHDRLLVQRALPGLRPELTEDIARVDEQLAGRHTRNANLAIAMLAAVEMLGWHQVAGMLDLSGVSRLVVAVGLAGIFVAFSRYLVQSGERPGPGTTGGSRPKAFMPQLRAFVAALGTRFLYALVVLAVVFLKVSDAVEDGEPWIRVLPQALLTAAACVGPALLIESQFKKTAEVRELMARKRGFQKRLGAEDARIGPAQRELERRHREVAHHEALRPRLVAAYQLEHARATARRAQEQEL